MKLTSDYSAEQDVDIINIIEDLQSKHRTVYWLHIYGQIYVYKPLGRRDYKEICEDDNLNPIDKEDEVCKRCLLYPSPKDLDFDNIDAGIMSKLFKTIMKNSFLESLEDRMGIMDYYRGEMFDMDNQIPCIINEAFPQYDIEEIENWDIERTAKYLSRAEWKLQNFRGAVFNTEMLEQMQQQQQVQQEGGNMNPPSKSNQGPQAEPQKAEQSNKKERLTPERLAQLKAIAPEINWEADTIVTEGVSGMQDSIDVVAPALRVGQW